MSNIDDLINFAANQQPTKFASAFDDIMGQKTTAAIEAMHSNVAQGIYASDEDLEDLDDEDTEIDVEDDEIDDDEFDDIDDLDLDDELDGDDFDDQDLEGLDDDGEDA